MIDELEKEINDLELKRRKLQLQQDIKELDSQKKKLQPQREVNELKTPKLTVGKIIKYGLAMLVLFFLVVGVMEGANDTLEREFGQDSDAGLNSNIATEKINPPAEISIPSNSQTQTSEPQSPELQTPESQPTESPKPKVTSATLSIDKVQIQLANLYPTRVTVTNTGDVSLSPKFDLYVYDNKDNEVCSGSPLIDEIQMLASGENQTAELLILGCSFSKDGAYTLKVDLLDENYNLLDSATKDFSVDYWSQFEFG